MRTERFRGILLSTLLVTSLLISLSLSSQTASASPVVTYSTLAEMNVLGGSGLNITETFEHAGAIPAGWTFTGNFAIKSTASGNHTPGGTYSAGITAGVNSTNLMISSLIDYTGKSNAHLNFWIRGTSTTAGSTIKVDASIDGGVTYTVPVVAQFTINPDSVHHQIFDDQDLSSLAGQSSVKFQWTVYRTRGNINLDDIQFTADAAPTCGVEVNVEPPSQEGWPSQVLEFTINVHNSGSVVDNIILSFLPDGWPEIWIDPPVLIDVAPCEWRQATLYVHVPDGTLPSTYKEIIVIAESELCQATDDAVVTVHVVEPPPKCGVEVIIENKLLEGPPSTVLAYTISVHNSGNVVDNIILSFEPDGWPDIYIDPPVLIDVAPCEWRQATLYVHVPDWAEPSTYKEIIVIAESEFCHATDSDSAQAHVTEVPVPWTGTAVFSLVNLYTVNVEKNLDLNQGSKLVVKFYTYGDAFENENVIENFTPPWNVEDNELARHPEGIGVKKARLVLTTADTSNELGDTIASFTVRKVDLETRFSRIPSEWFLAQPPERTELETEFSRIPSAWFLAPS